ncbi:hypothetical protein QU38_01920, partial [Staphylococcus aureus]
MRERGDVEEQRREDRGRHGRKEQHDHVEPDRPAGQPPGLRGFGGRGDAGDQQRDDQRHDRHLQAVEPGLADRLGPFGGDQRRGGRPGGEHRAEDQSRDQGQQGTGWVRHARPLRNSAPIRGRVVGRKGAGKTHLGRKNFGTGGIRGGSNPSAV